MQRVVGRFGDKFEFLDLPEPDAPLLGDLRWGAFEHPLTPAFWVAQAWLTGKPSEGGFQLGRTLEEEVVYCVLGGYGIPAEVGVAAAQRVCRALPQLSTSLDQRSLLRDLLSRPLEIAGRNVKYRFASQRAAYLARALAMLTAVDEPELSDVALRNALLELPGIGPKTASWIVRNRRTSNDVAILDVHIVRACKIMRVFPQTADPARRYFELEERFLAFCRATGSAASSMDAVMWSTMRALGQKFMQQLVDGVMCVGNSSDRQYSEGANDRVERLA
ncbi:endonuclease III domain-containing protein [Bradyrhizobium sp. CCGB12]|uniref:8-oxoguanine DNA glycosylase n=1 Tax=Bradyrhizobium sp. CCGB12 TaxID=2949632 RepID=UPI0020B33E76|nr:endonuclease III domain-containing protein [Bradyrhizobium sp. CCGB12]MCP3392025.1 endonuclease III domain-containing protein [Bradyrhizobium sp. CCGB12]